jgi:two-component system, NarL family, sensor kinase
MGNISQEVILIAASSAFFLFVAIGIIILVLTYQKRKLSYLKEKELMKSSFEKELLNSQLEIQEQTLKNISQEIHDNIGQALTLAKLNLNTMSIENTDQLQQKIALSKTLVSKAIVDLRDLSHSLNTDYVAEMGLLRSIEYELEMISKTGLIKTSLQIDGQAYRFDGQKELITFRIVQEVLNNIIKHAKAENIIVTADYRIDALELSIKDDGLGFEPVSAEQSKNSQGVQGLGMRNMYNRAKLIGAAFVIDSSAGKGTLVKISLSKENNHVNERTTKN